MKPPQPTTTGFRFPLPERDPYADDRDALGRHERMLLDRRRGHRVRVCGWIGMALLLQVLAFALGGVLAHYLL